MCPLAKTNGSLDLWSSTPERGSSKSLLRQTDVLVIGAGASGLLASVLLARSGFQVTLLEAEAQAGQKLALTGGGRCNIGRYESTEDVLPHYAQASRFLTSALTRFSPLRQLEILSDLGLKLEQEEQRAYVKGGAAHARDQLIQQALDYGVNLILNARVSHLELSQPLIAHCDRGKFAASAILIATGGGSFAHTGSTGQMLQLLGRLNFSLRPFSDGLRAFSIKQNDLVQSLSGISLPDVDISFHSSLLKAKQNPLRAKGSLLLTQKGLSGTSVLNLSRYLYRPEEKHDQIWVDFFPEASKHMKRRNAELDPEHAQQHIEELLRQSPKMKIVDLYASVLPLRMRKSFLEKALFDPQLQIAQLNRAERLRLLELWHHHPFEVCRDEKELRRHCGMVSTGGLSLKEISPKTFSAKRFPQLFFAGELLDIDGDCGGYNLIACFASALAAVEGIQELLRS